MNKNLKSPLWLLALPLLLWTSCQKEAEPVAAVAGTQAKIAQLNSIAVQYDQREMFTLLSPEEKQQAWREHFGHARRQLGNTPQRSELIERMQRWNDEKNMFADADYAALLNTVHFKNWEQEARQVFSVEEIYFIVSSLDVEYRGLEGIPNVGGGIGPAGGGDEPAMDCECMHVAGSTIFCPYVSYTFSIVPSITIKEGICPIDKMCRQKVNCGWWWGSMCNGMCAPV